jgi:hypothetical protein
MGEKLLRRRLIHYHYVLSMTVYNRVHHKGLVYPFGNFCRRIFNYATPSWALIEMVDGWERFAKDGTPCPAVFTPDVRNAAVKLGKELETAVENERMLRNLAGYGRETWVPVAEHEKAMASGQQMKRKMLEVYSEDEVMTDEKRALIVACFGHADPWKIWAKWSSRSTYKKSNHCIHSAMSYLSPPVEFITTQALLRGTVNGNFYSSRDTSSTMFFITSLISLIFKISDLFTGLQLAVLVSFPESKYLDSTLSLANG